jgi:hypothetical protein
MECGGASHRFRHTDDRHETPDIEKPRVRDEHESRIVLSFRKAVAAPRAVQSASRKTVGSISREALWSAVAPATAFAYRLIDTKLRTSRSLAFAMNANLALF